MIHGNIIYLRIFQCIGTLFIRIYYSFVPIRRILLNDKFNFLSINNSDSPCMSLMQLWARLSSKRWRQRPSPVRTDIDRFSNFSFDMISGSYWPLSFLIKASVIIQKCIVFSLVGPRSTKTMI